MKRIVIALFALILFQGATTESLLAQYKRGSIDSLQIAGPHEIVPGQLVRLDAHLQPEESPLWIVLNPTDLDYELAGEGSRLIFTVDSRQTGPVSIMLLAQQVRDGRIVTRQLRRMIAIGANGSDGPDTSPPREDDDEEDPSGPEPPGDFARSPLYVAAIAAIEKIQPAPTVELRVKIAANFDSIAARCESGAINSKAEIWERLSEANRTALGAQVGAWDPLGRAMQSGFQSLGLSEPPAHAFHLRAIAAALRDTGARK